MSPRFQQKLPAKHLLILGCGRSGTSIFGELFEHLPNYTYHSEPYFATLADFDYQQPIAIKVPKESPEYPPDAGLSFPLNALFELIPSLVIFWQVRHPLDTICSLKVGISKNWGHHPQPPDWKNWLSEPLIKQCAHHWSYLNSVGYQQVASVATITRFENMIQAPQLFAERICQQVGVDTQLYQNEIATWAKRVQNSNTNDFIEAKTSRPYSTNDHTVRIGRWKENMTLKEKRLITPLIEETASTFGYELR